MKFKELCIQADLALRALNGVRKRLEYEVVLYVGLEEWRELCDHAPTMGDESIKKKDARFYGCPVRMLDLDNYFGAGIELKNEQ